jgi:hypothetical protein
MVAFFCKNSYVSGLWTPANETKEIEMHGYSTYSVGKSASKHILK